MYRDIESTLLNNGNSGKSFRHQRGVTQGCPHLAYLFITALETTRIILNKNTN